MIGPRDFCFYISWLDPDVTAYILPLNRRLHPGVFTAKLPETSTDCYRIGAVAAIAETYFSYEEQALALAAIGERKSGIDNRRKS